MTLFLSITLLNPGLFLLFTAIFVAIGSIYHPILVSNAVHAIAFYENPYLILEC
jgi:hypothetical protein